MKQILLLLFIMSSCVPRTSQEAQIPEQVNVERIAGGYNDRMRILLIDSCEYIATDVYMGQTLVHKGNCKNHAK